MRVKQLSVFLENQPGRLASAAAILRDAAINIRALSLADTADFGILRMIVDDPNAALAAMKKAGFSVAETDVLAVRLSDRPGGLAAVAEKLSRAGIGIEYLYAFVGKQGDEAVVVLRVEDIDRTAGVLASAGIKALKSEEVYNL